MDRAHPQAQKPTLRDLCREHRVSLFMLAHASGRHPLLIWDIFVGNGTTAEEAHMVLAGFNSIHETSYRLEDIQLTILPKDL